MGRNEDLSKPDPAVLRKHTARRVPCRLCGPVWRLVQLDADLGPRKHGRELGRERGNNCILAALAVQLDEADLARANAVDVQELGQSQGLQDEARSVPVNLEPFAAGV